MNKMTMREVSCGMCSFAAAMSNKYGNTQHLTLFPVHTAAPAPCLHISLLRRLALQAMENMPAPPLLPPELR